MSTNESELAKPYEKPKRRTQLHLRQDLQLELESIDRDDQKFEELLRQMYAEHTNDAKMIDALTARALKRNEKYRKEMEALIVRKIEQTEGYENLVRAYEAKAIRDSELISSVKNRYPSARLLSLHAAVAPGNDQGCIGLFQRLGRYLRGDKFSD